MAVSDDDPAFDAAVVESDAERPKVYATSSWSPPDTWLPASDRARDGFVASVVHGMASRLGGFAVLPA